ncbi:hypothetical protein D3C81_2231610 [compost metagenome]
MAKPKNAAIKPPIGELINCFCWLISTAAMGSTMARPKRAATKRERAVPEFA